VGLGVLGMPEIDVTVLVERAHADELRTVVERLESMGLRGVEKRERFGIVQGKIEASKLPELGQVKGVKSVRQDRVYKAQ
jgi:hypothetical protein